MGRDPRESEPPSTFLSGTAASATASPPSRTRKSCPRSPGGRPGQTLRQTSAPICHRHRFPVPQVVALWAFFVRWNRGLPPSARRVTRRRGAPDPAVRRPQDVETGTASPKSLTYADVVAKQGEAIGCVSDTVNRACPRPTSSWRCWVIRALRCWLQSPSMSGSSRQHRIERFLLAPSRHLRSRLSFLLRDPTSPTADP